jgi:hypothetical protein
VVQPPYSSQHDRWCTVLHLGQVKEGFASLYPVLAHQGQAVCSMFPVISRVVCLLTPNRRRIVYRAKKPTRKPATHRARTKTNVTDSVLRLSLSYGMTLISLIIFMNAGIGVHNLPYKQEDIGDR